MQGKIKKLEDIFLFSMPIKNYQIVEVFLVSAHKDEVMEVVPVQSRRAPASGRALRKQCPRPLQLTVTVQS
jgi:hypothetical protein